MIWIVGFVAWYLLLCAFMYQVSLRNSATAKSLADRCDPLPPWWTGYWRFVTFRYHRNGNFLFSKDPWRDRE